MKAREKMARRHDLYHTLVDIDIRLSMAHMSEDVSKSLDLLDHRVKICRAMERVGFTAWDLEMA